MGPFEILCIFAAIFLFLYYYTTSNHDFWKVRGVPGPKPIPFFGNVRDLLFNRIYIGDFARKMYEQYQDESMVGILARNSPILILRDPELIKEVLIKNFNVFAHRGLKFHEKVDPLTSNLFFLEPKRWRPMRKNLSPTFTSGKLKEMFHLLVESSDQLENHLGKIVKVNEPIECRQLTSKFTIDVIASCVFGIDTKSLSNEKDEFFRMGKEIFNPTLWRDVKRKMSDVTPKLYNFLRPIMSETKINNFFINLVKDTMQYRKEKNYVRHDFIDLLRQVKENPERLNDIELSDDLLAAQAFVFFIAGFETSSTTMSNALYELAHYPQYQDKLRAEIREELKETNGKVIYDRIKNMKYLHKVFQETLRRYPPVSFLLRKATEKYTFSGTNVTIPKDLTVWIPTYGIHHDPKIYPDPETFDPERFDEEAEKSRHPMQFLPFGDGPRNCIGSRFAIYQTKVGLIKVLKNYKVEVCGKTSAKLINNPRSFLLRPMEGIYLKFSKVI